MSHQLAEERQAQLKSRWNAAVELHRNVTIPLDLDVAAATIILGYIQLALRHPDNVGQSRQIATSIGVALTERLKAIDPALGAVADLGWNKECDERNRSATCRCLGCNYQWSSPEPTALELERIACPMCHHNDIEVTPIQAKSPF